MCPACGGLAYVLLGILGRVTHCRCRACGMDFSLVDDGHDADAPYWAQED